MYIFLMPFSVMSAGAFKQKSPSAAHLIQCVASRVIALYVGLIEIFKGIGLGIDPISK